MSTPSTKQGQSADHSADEASGGLLEALVAAERASMEPPVDAQKETWSRVAASVAAGGATPLAPASVAGPAAAASAPWIKIVLGVLLGGVFAVAAYRLGSDPKPEPAAQTAALPSAQPREVTPAPATPPAPAATRAQPPPVPQQPVAVLPPQPPPAPVSGDATPLSKPTAAQPAPAVPSEPPASDLAEETRLLALARARLGAGSPAEAFAALDEHQRRFPRGQLSEDRMVLRAQALCESGDTKAGRKQIAALRKAFAKSSHLPRINRICAE